MATGRPADEILEGGGGSGLLGLPFTCLNAAAFDRPTVPDPDDAVVIVGVLRGGGGGGALGGGTFTLPSLGRLWRSDSGGGGSGIPTRDDDEMVTPADTKLSKLGRRSASADGDMGIRPLSLGRR